MKGKWAAMSRFTRSLHAVAPTAQSTYRVLEKGSQGAEDVRDRWPRDPQQERATVTARTRTAGRGVEGGGAGGG